MCDILIRFSKRDFEYDVYTLVKAFYANAEIKTLVGQEDASIADVGPAGILMEVGIGDSLVTFSYSENGKERIEGESGVPVGSDRIAVKNILKRLIYKTLSSVGNRQLPWGSLTGIRPAKIPMKLLNEGMDPDDIAARMKESYFISDKKAALAIMVAQNERELLGGLDLNNSYSLYIGIPFCPSICLYCSFGSHPMDRFGKYIDDYLAALFKELRFTACLMANKRLVTVYIGGGTPTTLSPDRLGELLSLIKNEFDLSRLKEFTVEAGRPDTVDPEKLKVLKDGGVTRISINPQSMNDATLDIIGRNHSVSQVRGAFHLARDAGFDNINMDMIAGLPGEGVTEARNTIDEICALNPDALTVHSLALKRATRLNLMKDEYAPVSFNNTQEIMDIAAEGAVLMGMEPYYMYRQKNIAGNLENVGYARRGCFCLYNILIMDETHDIIAAGSGAISKFVYGDGRIERAANVKDLKNYIERVDEMCERKEKHIKCS